MYHKVLKFINKIIDYLLIFFIKIYQKTLSPDKWILSFWLKWKICAHEPHCSQYAINHIKRYWWARSIIPIFDRVFGCVPSYIKKYHPTHYKVVFFSSAKIGIPFLKILMKDDRFDIIWLVTQPDQPSWRWLHMQPNIVKKRTNENYPDIEVNTPSGINPSKSKSWKQFISWLEEKKPDYLVVISYGKIIPESILNIAKIWPINVHWSLLPKYRWASPIQSVFLTEEDRTGITIMLMDAWLDSWDIISQYIIPIDFNDTVEDTIHQFEKHWPKFLKNTLISYGKGDVSPVSQNESIATTTNKIEKQDGKFDIFHTDIQTVYKRYRAYYLWPKIWFIYQDKRYIVEKLKLDKLLFEHNISLPIFTDNTIDAHHIHPAIKELIIKPEGRKSITYIDWLHSLQS